MSNRWIGLALALALTTSAAPLRAQYLVTPQEPSGPSPEPIPFAPSMAGNPNPPPGGGFVPPSKNSLPCDLPNASSDPPKECDHNCFYFSAEYLHWWIRNDNLQGTQITTSTSPNLATNFGALFQPNTVPLAGGAPMHQGPFDGVRATVGFAPDWFCPIEISGFFLRGNHSSVFFSNGDGNSPVLSRPIFATQPALFQEVVFSAGFPNVAAGSVGIISSTQLFGGEVNVIACSLIKDPEFTKWTLEGSVGARYAALNEDLNIFNTTTSTQATTFLNFNGQAFGQFFTTAATDQFNTRNQFAGGQFGLRASRPLGPLNLELKGNAAFGMNHEIAGVYGASALYGNPIINQSLPQNTTPIQIIPGGVQAVASNSGRFVRNKFSTVEEFGVTLGYPILETMQISVGYNLFYWSNVIRPGEQVIRLVDTRQVPTDPQYNPNIVGNGPVFPFQRVDFWAQGLTLSLAITF